MNWVIICSGNGLSPVRRQAITWTNIGLLSIWLLGTNFSEIWIEIPSFSFKKMHLQMSSAKLAAILSRGRWVNEIQIQLELSLLIQLIVLREIFGCDIEYVVLLYILIINTLSISSEFALRWTPQDFSTGKSTLFRVMASYNQATSHYLDQCWLSSKLPYGVIRRQWVGKDWPNHNEILHIPKQLCPLIIGKISMWSWEIIHHFDHERKHKQKDFWSDFFSYFFSQRLLCQDIGQN